MSKKGIIMKIVMLHARDIVIHALFAEPLNMSVFVLVLHSHGNDSLNPGCSPAARFDKASRSYSIPCVYRLPAHQSSNPRS